MNAFLRVVRDIALLVARIIAGSTLIAHGWHRWQVSGIDEQVTILSDAGLPAAQGLVVATIAFELIGGVLLAFGLATPLIGLGMVVLNVTIILTVREHTGFYLASGGWEYNAVQAALGLMLLVFGSGRVGLDHLFMRPAEDVAPLIDGEPVH